MPGFRNRPEQLVVGQLDLVDRVEGLQNLFVRTQAECAQEDGAEELALTVDAHIERVLLVVFELNPRTAIGNDLAQEVAAVVRGLKEDARRTMQLRNDDALGPVHDEGAVRRHQRNVAEEDFLLLDVADGLRTRFRVLVVNGQAYSDLERSGEGHAALFALLLVILQLQAHRVAALVAEVRRVLVVRAAMVTENVARMERVGDHHESAVDAGGTQVMQSLEVTALALPVADREVDESQAARYCGSR